MKPADESQTLSASELISRRIAEFGDWRGVALARMRELIKQAEPEVVEEWKWMGTPVWSHDGIVFLAKAFKDKVKVTFPNGASLADPDKVFNAELTGNAWRAIDIYKDDKINESSLKTLIQAAIGYNRSKVKPDGRAGGKRSTLKKKPAK